MKIALGHLPIPSFFARHLFKSERRGKPGVFLVVHNPSHVALFRDVLIRLAELDIAFTVATIDDHFNQAAAVTALQKAGLAWIPLSQIDRRIQAGDVLCVANDWGPRELVKLMSRLRRRGVRLVGVIEGAQFSLHPRYRRVDEILGWGPSAKTVFDVPVHIVGSPKIEAATQLQINREAIPSVLINFRSKRREQEDGAVWVENAVGAAREVFGNCLLSVHPGSVDQPEYEERRPGPILSHFPSATVLITRASTLIYEALAAKLPVIYCPFPDDKRAEFVHPLGAYPVAESREELIAALSDVKTGRGPTYDGSKFLEWHVSMEPQTSAAVRIANALGEMCNAKS